MRTPKTIVAGLVGAAAALAQYAPPPPAQSSPGLANARLRAADPRLAAWDIALNYRLRHEAKLGAGFTDAGSNWDFSRRPADDTRNRYLVSRAMPRVAYAGRRFAFTVEGRASSSIGDERFNAAAPGRGLAENDSGLDVHQTFVLIGNPKEFPLSLKFGRQELAYGDQRLVGPVRWNNNARTFDALKVRWQHPLLGVDLFTGGVVYNDSHNLNRSNPQDRFSGACFNFPALLKHEIAEAYLLARNVARGIATDDWRGVPAPFRFPGAQDIYTAGLRVKSKPGAYDPFDYGVELMQQFGNRTAVFPGTTIASALAAPRLDHRASAFVGQAGCTWTQSPLRPRLALVYSYGSGDRSAADSKSGTFQNLFPTNHLFYGYMDLSSLQNLHDLRVACTLRPAAAVVVALEGHAQFLGRTSDFWYNVGGVPRNFAGAVAGSGGGYRINPGYSKQVGHEIDLVAGWTPAPHAQIEAAACRYFRGDYIKQSLAAVGSKDATYFYVQLTLNL